MSEPDAFHQISEYLRKENYSEEEIGRILSRLHEYDVDTMVDSIMDSIATDQEDIQTLINQVLEERSS